MNNHSIKGTTLEISDYAFVCYLCFIDQETKENQSIKRACRIHRLYWLYFKLLDWRM